MNTSSIEQMPGDFVVTGFFVNNIYLSKELFFAVQVYVILWYCYNNDDDNYVAKYIVQ